MGQSLVQIPVHLVFSTSDRIPYLQDPDIRMEMHRYLCGTARHLGSPVLRINGTGDHVHILCSLGKQEAVADLLRKMKSNSTKWAHERFSGLEEFHWQKGYGAFGVSPSGIPGVIRYIDNQENHHQHFSFEDEFRKLCEAAGLVIDERYVWE